MAMFGSNEKKEAKAQAKADAKAAKIAAKEQAKRDKEDAMLRRFGVEGLNDPKSIEIIRDISGHLAGDSLMDLGEALGGFSEKDYIERIYEYSGVQVRQNWLIIRQLDRIATALEKQEQNN